MALFICLVITRLTNIMYIKKKYISEQSQQSSQF